jgi:branched-chain amino acid transport system substrate-binding protein
MSGRSDNRSPLMRFGAFMATFAIAVGCSGSASPAASNPAETTGAGGSAPAGSAPAGSQANVNCDQPIKIGVLVPYTGSLNADAQEIWNAAGIAIEEVNAAGGVNCRKLEAVLGDTVDQRPEQVSSAANQLFKDKAINLIMTAYADQGNIELDQMAEEGMPYLLSSNATVTRDVVSKDPAKYWNIWSMVPSYDAYNTEFPKLVDKWLRAIPGFTMTSPSIFNIASDNPYSVGISDGMNDTFKSIGWTVSGYEKVPFGTVSDWGSILAKIRANPPTVIVNTDYQPSNDATFMQQFRTNPTNSVMFIQYGPINAEFCQLAGDNGTGVLYQSLGGAITGGTSDSAKMAQTIKDKYEAKFGKGSTGYFFSVGYTDVMLYVDAIKAVGDPADRKGIAGWFQKLDTVTASGHLVYDQTTHLATYGDTFMPLQIWQIGKDCARPLIYPPNLTTDAFKLPPWMTAK